MFLIIIGLVVLFIGSFFIYEKAKANKRNAAAWTMLAVGAFLGTYLLLLIIFGMLINVGIGQSIWTMNGVMYVGEIVHLVILVLSMSGVLLVLRWVSQKSDTVSNSE